MLNCIEQVHLIGYIHRDIKPDNFMATKEGKIILVDFGIALNIVDENG